MELHAIHRVTSAAPYLPRRQVASSYANAPSVIKQLRLVAVMPCGSNRKA